MKKLVLGLAVAFALVGASSASAYTFNTNLTLGSAGADVVALQDMLIAGGHLVMPAGVSKGYFGALTQTAVAKWQAANGIAPAAGYFGPVSRMKASSSVSTPTTPSTPSTSMNGGDGDFKNFDQISSVDNETLETGDSEQVLAFEFEADDSDLKIERVNVEFTDGASKPWKYFDEVTLFHGSKKVSSVDASDEDNWDEQADDEYEISFTDINVVVKEGDDAEFYVEVTANDDDDDLPLSWTATLQDEGVRAMNGDGINVYSDEVVTTDFDQEEADASDLDLTFKTNDNEDKPVEVDDATDMTEEVLLYTFVAESQDGDVEVDEVTVTLATTSGTDSVEDMIKTVYLFIDGKEVGSESGDTTVTFEDISTDLSEDEKVDIEIFVDVEGTDDDTQFTSGSGVEVTGIDIDYIDDQDDDQTQSDLTSTDGGDVTFYTTGVNVVYKTSAATVTYGSFSGDTDKAVFSITFEVTAFGNDDIYIGGANTTGSSNAGITYTISSSTAGTVTKAELKTTSGAEKGDNNTFIVGDSETFTFTVEVSDASTTVDDVAQKLTITGIKWDIDDDSSPDETYNDNLDDFETDSKTI